MPKNWYQWIMHRESESVKCKNAAEIFKDVQDYGSSSEKKETRDQSVVLRTCKNDYSHSYDGTPRSSMSSDSGFESCFSDDDNHDDIKTHLTSWIDKVRNNRRPTSLKPTSNPHEHEHPCKNVSKNTLGIKADPYEIFHHLCQSWDGSFDDEGLYHGRGCVNFTDGGTTFGTWRHGVRYRDVS